MTDWIKIGTRYVNLINVTEVRIHEQPRFARIYFTTGATVDLDEDDTEVLLLSLAEQVVNPAATRRTVISQVT
jgi:hypothetical protein